MGDDHPLLTIRAVHLKRPETVNCLAWSYARNVLISLCERANGNDPLKRVWPSMARLVVDTGLTTYAVRSGLRTLQKLTWIRLEAPARQWKTPVWSIHLPNSQTSEIRTPESIQTSETQTSGIQTSEIQTSGTHTPESSQTSGIQTSGIQTSGISRSGVRNTLPQSLKEPLKKNKEQPAEKEQPVDPVENSDRPQLVAKEQPTADRRPSPTPTPTPQIQIRQALARKRAAYDPNPHGNRAVVSNLAFDLFGQRRPLSAPQDDDGAVIWEETTRMENELRDACEARTIRYDTAIIAYAVGLVRQVWAEEAQAWEEAHAPPQPVIARNGRRFVSRKPFR